MNKLKVYLNDNAIVMTSLLVMMIIRIVYLMDATANIPIMDYWRYASNMLPEILDHGGITFSTLWEPINGQRGVVVHALFVLNVLLFKWNTRIGIFGGALVLFISSIVIYNYYMKEIVGKTGGKSIDAQLLGIALIAIIMNYSQWELDVLEFSLPYNITILTVIMTLLWGDRIIRNNQSMATILYYSVFLSFSIFFIFSAFFPGVIIALGIAWIVSILIRDPSLRKPQIKKGIPIVLFALISIFLYMNDLTGISGTSFNMSEFASTFFDGEFFKSALYYLAGSILHNSYNSEKVILLVGSIVFVAYVLSLVFYIKRKIYLRTFFPVMMMAYTLITGLLLIYARGVPYGYTYMNASRYVYSSKLGIAGIVIIIGHQLEGYYEYKKISERLLKPLTILVVGLTLIVFSLSFWAEWRTKQHKRQYFETAISLLPFCEYLPDDILAIYQDVPENIRNTARYMKANSLGIFQHGIMEGPFDNDEYNYIYGVYEDGWLAQDSYLSVQLDDEGNGKCRINGYYPGILTGEEYIDIYIDGDYYSTNHVNNNSFEIGLLLEKNRLSLIHLSSNFAYDTNLDDRDLCFLIESFLTDSEIGR